MTARPAPGPGSEPADPFDPADPWAGGEFCWDGLEDPDGNRPPDRMDAAPPVADDPGDDDDDDESWLSPLMAEYFASLPDDPGGEPPEPTAAEFAAELIAAGPDAAARTVGAMEPGARSAAVLAMLDPAVLSPASMVSVILATEKLASWVQARQHRWIAAFACPGTAAPVRDLMDYASQPGQPLDPAKPARTTTPEAPTSTTSGTTPPAAGVGKGGASGGRAGSGSGGGGGGGGAGGWSAELRCSGSVVHGDPDIDTVLTQTAVKVAAAEIGAALRFSPIAAYRRVSQAVEFAVDLPSTLRALEAGSIDRGRALTIADRTQNLPVPLRRRVEQVVLPKAVTRTPGQLRGIVDRAVISVDPAAAKKRHERALAERDVQHRAGPDGTGIFRAELAADKARLAYSVIDELAGHLKRSPGQITDPRRIGALRADVFSDLFDQLATTGTITVRSTLHRRATTEPETGTGSTSTEPETSTDPTSTDSTSTEATGTEPGDPEPTTSTEPANTEPTSTEPANTEPTSTEPVGTEPVGVEPAGHEPANTEPTSTEPVGTEPVGVEPAGHEPANTEPTSTEPVGTEPVGVEPAGHEPANTEPTSAEPTGAEPIASEPADQPAKTEPAGTVPTDPEPAGAGPRADEPTEPQPTGTAPTGPAPTGPARTGPDPASTSTDHSTADPEPATDPERSAEADEPDDPHRRSPDPVTDTTRPEPATTHPAAPPAPCTHDCGCRPHHDPHPHPDPDPGTSTGTGWGTHHGRHTHLNVTIAHSTLTGHDDHPGELDGHGPIPADLARAIAHSAATINTIAIDPTCGTALDLGRTTYRPRLAQKDHVTTRDQTCRFPGCRQPAHRCQLDHSNEYCPDQTTGGVTCPCNLACLCVFHHNLKTSGLWDTEQHPNGTITWTSPTHRTYQTHPRQWPTNHDNDEIQEPARSSSEQSLSKLHRDEPPVSERPSEGYLGAPDVNECDSDAPPF